MSDACRCERQLGRNYTGAFDKIVTGQRIRAIRDYVIVADLPLRESSFILAGVESEQVPRVKTVHRPANDTIGIDWVFRKVAQINHQMLPKISWPTLIFRIGLVNQLIRIFSTYNCHPHASHL
jgi:hypothetical protein